MLCHLLASKRAHDVTQYPFVSLHAASDMSWQSSLGVAALGLPGAGKQIRPPVWCRHALLEVWMMQVTQQMQATPPAGTSASLATAPRRTTQTC